MTEELDYTKLDRELDKVKAKVFIGKSAAFLGPLMCQLNFTWSEDIPTACTNGISIQWNPHWFQELPFNTRLTVLVHELWHVAFMHMIRRGNRIPLIFNWAADIHINNMLENMGYTFEGTSPWKDQYYGERATEDIYDELISKMTQPSAGAWGQSGDGSEDAGSGLGDLVEGDIGDEGGSTELTPHQINTIIGNVVAATTAANMAGKPGDVPGDIQITLNKFLTPKLPWEQLLYKFFNELSEPDYSYKRPNRRYSEAYMPSLLPNEGLEHLIYYLDVSGSVSDNEVNRFNSEVKYIKETFNPLKLTLVLFDTKIQKEYVFHQDDPFDEIVVVGRGGTSLACVREHIIENNPTAAIIFSDLYCDPMQKLPSSSLVPIIYICVNNRGGKVTEGQLIHINE